MGDGFAGPWLKVIEELGGHFPVLHGPTIDDCFAGWEKLGGLLVSTYQFPAPDLSVKTEDRTIPDGIKVRIYTPPSGAPNKPVAFYIHGGGWAMGDLDMEDGDCRKICKDAGVVLVSVDYRLAPQHKYPGGLEDCYKAFLWTYENAGNLGGKAGKIFTIGPSAGGGSAIAVALKAIDKGQGEKLKGVVAQVPVTVHPDAVPADFKSRYTSYEENAESTVNSASAMRAFIDAYGAPPDDKYASPLLHPRIKDLPHVYLTGAGKDTLRDDARLFKEALDNNGVPNMYDEDAGLPHYYWTFPSPSLDVPRAEHFEKLVKGIEFVMS